MTESHLEYAVLINNLASNLPSWAKDMDSFKAVLEEMEFKVKHCNDCNEQSNCQVLLYYFLGPNFGLNWSLKIYPCYQQRGAFMNNDLLHLAHSDYKSHLQSFVLPSNCLLWRLVCQCREVRTSYLLAFEPKTSVSKHHCLTAWGTLSSQWSNLDYNIHALPWFSEV